MYLRIYDEQGATGTWKSFYDSGEIASIENYKDGNPDGFWVDYYKNGQICRAGEKVSGKEIGEWKTYNDQGTLLQNQVFENGVVTPTTRY